MPTRSRALTKSTSSKSSWAKLPVFHLSPMCRLFFCLCCALLSFYRLMFIDHSLEAHNDQLSNGHSLDAPSWALRAQLLQSLTWSWKTGVKVTPISSSRTTLSHGVWSVITLRCWHQHQRLEKTVSFSKMYRFRYLLGLEHSKCTRVARRVG